MDKVEKVFLLAVEYDSGDPKRIQHFIKVRRLARLIGKSEGLCRRDMTILETAAILHDIGIHVCEEKYGGCGGKLQEREGPAVAREILIRSGGYSQEEIDEIKFLIAHHHTYTGIDRKNWQILVEADFLVNLYEDGAGRRAINSTLAKIFKTARGTKLCRDMFGL